MTVPAKNLKALAKQGRSALMTGARGGKYYLTAAGEKVYADKLPDEGADEAAPARREVSGAAAANAQRAAPARQAKDSVPMSRVKTQPVPKVKRDGKLVPGAAPGSQLPPELKARLKELGAKKLPGAHIGEVKVSLNINNPKAHDGALMKWKDDKGKTQSVYSADHDKASAERKFARVMKNRPKIEAALDDLRSKAADSPAHAATLLIATTALRPGGAESAKSGHYGATTMQTQHVKFRDGEAHIEFIGKQGKLNKAVVDDPALVAALRKYTKGKAPTDKVFDASIESIRAAAPPGVLLKDMRTSAATTHAENELRGYKFEPTGSRKDDAKLLVGILKAVSTSVAQRLNNTANMARKSYIAPQVIRAWAKQFPSIDPKWLEP